MEFDDFVQRVDAAVRERTSVEGFEEPRGASAAWKTRGRTAAIELVPPRNVSVTLGGHAQQADTTWYPVDAALVPVVSKRIAGYLSEA